MKIAAPLLLLSLRHPSMTDVEGRLMALLFSCCHLSQPPAVIPDIFYRGSGICRADERRVIRQRAGDVGLRRAANPTDGGREAGRHCMRCGRDKSKDNDPGSPMTEKDKGVNE